MDYEFDKTGTNWNNVITSEDCFIRTFDFAHLLLTQSHPILEHLKPLLLGKYRVVMKFKSSHASDGIYINGTRLVSRNSKTSPVVLGRGVKLLKGTDIGAGGSNKYPLPCFKEGYCIIEFISNGLPKTNYLSGWDAELIELEPITK